MDFPDQIAKRWNNAIISKILFGPIADSNHESARINNVTLYDGFKEYRGTAYLTVREEKDLILYSAYLVYFDEDERSSTWYFSGEHQDFEKIIKSFEIRSLAPRIF